MMHVYFCCKSISINAYRNISLNCREERSQGDYNFGFIFLKIRCLYHFSQGESLRGNLVRFWKHQSNYNLASGIFTPEELLNFEGVQPSLVSFEEMPLPPGVRSKSQRSK